MLEQVDFSAQMDKQTYRAEAEPLLARLEALQHRMKEAKLPVMVIFEGWGAAGKGSRIAGLIEPLDPRSFNVFSVLPPDRQERRRPFLWRHWVQIPARGMMHIYDRSYYPEVSIAQLEENLSASEALGRMEDINTFERQLADDGYLIIKFFLHISKGEQKKRLDKLAELPETAWRATERDFTRNRHYDQYAQVFDEMLEKTHTPWAPWHIISGRDKRHAMYTILRTVVERMEAAVSAAEPTGWCAPERAYEMLSRPPLAQVDLDKRLEKEVYRTALKQAQRELAHLHNQIYRLKIPVVLVYEGWDAAGKGGNIRRLTAALDPRGYDVVPIAGPTAEELSHHYLWRFWKQIPKDGHIAIFDRSWYGRVMVERIEGLCPQPRWEQAYQEINEFEKQLTDFGAVVLKFWLHIDPDEQLRRFNDRQNTPEKQWKITQEDWRNREKWPQYEQAVDEMIRRTSTKSAPWIIVESQDKRYARIKAIQSAIQAIEARIQGWDR